MSGDRLDGLVALVTGASSGIGAATARWLSAEGATVALVARRRGRLEQLRAEIEAGGGSARVVSADLSQPDRAAQAVQCTLDDLGRLDILVNTAGLLVRGTTLQATVEDWDQMVAVNVTAMLHVTYAAVPFLIDAVASSGRGVADIVNVAAGPEASSGSSVYALTKLGLVGFTESLRRELAPRRVRVGLVEPEGVGTGPISPLSNGGPHPVGRRAAGLNPLRPSDVAEVVGFVVTRERRVGVNKVLVRPGDQSW